MFGAWEYVFHDGSKDARLVDAFRHLHPDQVTRSWYGRSGNGFRFGRISVTSGHIHRIVACDCHHEAREAGPTDHAVMTLRLDLTRPSRTVVFPRSADSCPCAGATVGVSAMPVPENGPLPARVGVPDRSALPLRPGVHTTSETHVFETPGCLVERRDTPSTPFLEAVMHPLPAPVPAPLPVSAQPTPAVPQTVTAPLVRRTADDFRSARPDTRWGA